MDTFIVQAFIYLAGAVIMVPIAQRLRLGSVLGYLAAGIIIGPSVLKFVGSESHDVMHFAEIGVVMMLFVIGLELNPTRVWEMRKKIIGLGGAQVVFTTSIIALFLFFLGFKTPEAITIGVIIAMSSTAIVMQIVEEKGWKQSAAGRNAFSVLLFQDIAIIPILAFLPLLAPKASKSMEATKESLISELSRGEQTLATIAAVVVIVLMGKYLLYPFFKMIARTRLREMFTATVLLLVIGVSIMMEAVGLSPALGAFLSGVLLANSEYRHELETAIDPFKGLFLGLFFIAVGSSINFEQVFDRPLHIASLVFGIVFFKIGLHFILGKIFKIRNAQNFIFSILLAQIGEFAFVLLSFSMGQQLISSETGSMMMIVAAISMALTPIIILLSEKYVLPLFCSREKNTKSEKESDIEEEHNRVIIAGYGHFGNTIGRFLNAHNIPITVLDNDSDNVDYLRKFGLKVYYGDATRYNLLQIAGANDAEIIVVAIGNEKHRMDLVEVVKKHFPHLYILLRSSNRNDAYNQMNSGIMHIYRETIDTSLRVGVDVLGILGFDKTEAERAAKTFLRHDEKTLKYLASIRNEQEYISMAREKMEELDLIIKEDHEKLQLGSSKLNM